MPIMASNTGKLGVESPLAITSIGGTLHSWHWVLSSNSSLFIFCVLQSIFRLELYFFHVATLPPACLVPPPSPTAQSVGKMFYQPFFNVFYILFDKMFWHQTVCPFSQFSFSTTFLFTGLPFKLLFALSSPDIILLYLKAICTIYIHMKSFFIRGSLPNPS